MIVHEWQMGRRELPAKSVVLTFDDGEESAVQVRLSGAQEIRPARDAVRGDLARGHGVERHAMHRLAAAARNATAAALFDIESHTHDLHYKVGPGNDLVPGVSGRRPRIPRRTRSGPAGTPCSSTILRNRAITIEREIGRTPHFLAWPYGFGNPTSTVSRCRPASRAPVRLRARPNRPLASGRLALSDTEHFEIPALHRHRAHVAPHLPPDAGRHLRARAVEPARAVGDSAQYLPAL